jgi:glycosyltransferase involved in cell wall biosynthesis
LPEWLAVLFSVLLPTRNRLEFLRYAVETVRRQDDPDWEIVVSDNDSEEDIAGYVADLGDDRVRYVRTDGFISVTGNWNNALRHSRGDYIIMLGDDDALLPGYFTAMRELIEDFQRPDAVYMGALLFAYPGVMPDRPEGYLTPNMTASFFAGAQRPFVLGRAQAQDLARAAMDFRVLYDFNMQYVMVSRPTVDALSGGGDFFRSPFPDYYAMNHVFARARRIVVDPQPRVVVGITRLSHGFFHFNHRESDARALLNTDGVDPEIRRALEPILLPGTNINTSWLMAMEALHEHLGRPADLRPNYARYRRLQAIQSAQAHYLHRGASAADMRIALAGLTRAERAALRVLGPPAGAILRRAPWLRRGLGAVLDRLVGQFKRGATIEQSDLGAYRDIVEVFEHRQAERDPVGARP